MVDGADDVDDEGEGHGVHRGPHAHREDGYPELLGELGADETEADAEHLGEGLEEGVRVADPPSTHLGWERAGECQQS